MKNRFKILFIFLIPVLVVGLIYLCVKEYEKMSYFFVEKSRKCTVIAKDIRQYNASTTRVVDLKYKNVFIVNSEGATFEVVVSDGLYYQKPIGSVVYFELSMNDMFESMPIKTIYGVSYQQDFPFVLYFFFSIVLIIIWLCLEPWKLLNLNNGTTTNR